jgi:protein ImuB
MKQVLCVWLPNFPIQRLRCQHPKLRSTACVLYQESGNRAQVVTASSEATRHGIGPGMPLAEAQALLESAMFLPHDADADRLELQTLARLAYRFSPLVGLEQPDKMPATHSLVLDITGCTHLFGDEAGLARQLVIELAELGYFAHVAIANTIGAAWAIARYGHGTGSARLLKSLPVEALRIPEQLTTRLREFDLRTIGQLLALPQKSLPSRFGKVLTARLDQMFGRRAELLIPVPRPEPVFAQWIADDPIGHPAAIRLVCTELLTEILDTLKSRGEGLLRLKLTLESESTEPVTLDIGLGRPAESAKHLLNLIQLKLEESAVPEWLNTIRMKASVTAPLQTQQRNLFDLQESTDNKSVRRLVDRLTTRLGRDAVVRPCLLPETVPEQAVGFTPLVEAVSDTRSVPASISVLARPTILLPQPEPVEVQSNDAGKTLESIRRNGRCYQIAHHTEPERIATAWWQEAGSVRRDYYRVETQTGARFWIFRDVSNHWFLHGVFE